jgi:arsenite methyltransferase
MVSDIVLLKELPKAIRENFEAYAGCLAGAEIRDKYLELIRKAGFQEVKIVEETIFPLEGLVSESTAQEIIKTLNLPPEKIKALANSIRSIKVSAVKTN